MSKKTVFLTGGSSDIGQAISRYLDHDGWRVIAPTHQELNLAKLDEVADFVFPVEDVDVFIHVAGVWHDRDAVLANKAFGGFTPEQITQTMNVGVNAPMLLVRRLLAEGKPSHVIGISGTFESGAKGWLPYYTSKRALEDFLVGLAQDNQELAVYAISPADTRTTAYERFYPEYAKSAQPVEAVSQIVCALLDGKQKYESGSVIELRDGKHKLGFHA